MQCHASVVVTQQLQQLPSLLPPPTPLKLTPCQDQATHGHTSQASKTDYTQVSQAIQHKQVEPTACSAFLKARSCASTLE